MKHLRTLLVVGCTLALHIPMASAKFATDFMVRSTQYGTQSQAPMSFEVTGTGTVMTGTGRLISRGEFTTLLIDKLYSEKEMDHCFADISPSWPRYTLLFTDVPVDQPDASALCIAMRDGIIRGYGDGSFHPDQPITFDEAAKIVSRAFVLAPYAETDTKSPWFMPYLKALSDRNAIPSSIKNIDQKITLKEGSDLIDRVNFGITWNPATSLESLLRNWAPMTRVPTSSVSHVRARTPLLRQDSVGSEASSIGSMSSARSESSIPAALPWYRIF